MLATTLAAALASIGLAALLAAVVVRRGRTHATSAAELSQD
jgi:hypothetical protein